MEKIPVTIITGYLGAGKTTLLRNLLAYATRNKLRLAIIMNEFGSVAIDSEIIKGANFDMVELAGGCVCCSLTGEFNAALAELAGNKNPPEHIVIETTGLAEPDALVVDLQEATEGFHLDSVVTVVDCDALVKSPSLGHTGRVQVEMADLLLLNKSDLATSAQLEEIRTLLTEINERATQVPCVRCEVDPSLVLDARRGPKEIMKLHADHTPHLGDVDSIVVEVKEPLSEERFAEFAYGLPASVYRSKGFIALDDGRTLLFNFVAGRFDFEEWEQKKSTTQLVFIGKDLSEGDKGFIEESLNACTSEKEEE